MSPLAAAELGDALLAAQPFQHDADLLFSQKVSTRRLFSAFSIPPNPMHGRRDQVGSMTQARNPPSGRLESVSWPPCAWTTDNAIANPRPIPPVSRFLEPSTR